MIGLCIREQKKAGEEQMQDGLEILTRGVENDAGLLVALASPERGQVFA